MSTVIITDHGFPNIDFERSVLEDAGFEVREIRPICKTEDDIIRTCGNADVLLVQWAPVTRKVLEALPNVKCIVRYGVGVNNFDLEAAEALGVVAANVPDFCVEEVSNHAMAMILSLCRRQPQDHQQIMQGIWDPNALRPLPAMRLLTLGLVSFGKIPQSLAVKAKVFGFEVIAFDPFAPDTLFETNGVRRVDFDTLLGTSDVLSLHCPLVPETTHLIDKAAFEKLKDGVILINTARGGVVDEVALAAALDSGKIRGLGLDVFEEEPLPADSPIRNFHNAVFTSHAASVSEKAVEMLQTKAAEAARDFLQGNRPKSALV